METYILLYRSNMEEYIVDRHKWFLLKLKNGKSMVVWCVKDEEEAIIVAKACIIRKNFDFELDIESIIEIDGLTDSKMIGYDDAILANN